MPTLTNLQVELLLNMINQVSFTMKDAETMISTKKALEEIKAANDATAEAANNG